MNQSVSNGVCEFRSGRGLQKQNQEIPSCTFEPIDKVASNLFLLTHRGPISANKLSGEKQKRPKAQPRSGHAFLFWQHF